MNKEKTRRKTENRLVDDVLFSKNILCSINQQLRSIDRRRGKKKKGKFENLLGKVNVIVQSVSLCSRFGADDLRSIVLCF